MSCPKPLRDAAAALSLLTVLPAGRCAVDEERGQPAAWFPAVGLLIGAMLFGAALLLLARPFPARLIPLAACLMVLAEALLTRLLHYDGLADVADAWWGGASVERRLEIMKDSATGAFGATALVFVAVVQVLAVSAVLESAAPVALLVAPVFARAAATCAAWLGSPARAGGLGRSVMARPTVMGLLTVFTTVAITCAAVWFVGGAFGLVLCAAGVCLALVVPHLVSLRMGGVTGDVMGASVLITHTTLVAMWAFMAGLT